MPIAKYVNSKQIQVMFYESGFQISYKKACEIKDELRKMHSSVKLPDERVIPKSWVLQAYGEQAYVQKEKDAPTVESKASSISASVF